MGAFHAYDIRGIYNVDFDKEVAYKVGYFLPELLNASKVLVGRDCRLSGQEIHDYLIKGITDAGADVDDIGYSSTPLVYFGTANYGYKASVQITAPTPPKLTLMVPRKLRRTERPCRTFAPPPFIRSSLSRARRNGEASMAPRERASEASR